MARKRGLGVLIVVLLVGSIVGGTLGELIGLVLGYFYPGSLVESFFLKAFVYEFPPTQIPLVVFSITLGFAIKVNIISLVGIGIAVYYFRWY